MIIFLYGQDSYRAKKKLEEIILGYKKVHKSGLNLVYFDVEEKDYKDFSNNFKITSMFKEKKLVILKNIFSDLKFQEEFLKNIKDLKSTEDIIVVYEIDKIDQRNKLFKSLIKESKYQEFSLLEDRFLRSWIKKEFERYGSKIEQDAEDLLLVYAGNDLWKLESEIKKLSNFKLESVIKKTDIETMIRPRIEIDIFKTIDALASKNKKLALNLLQKHLDNGDNPLYLLSMIGFQFRNLLSVKELIDKRNPYPAISKKSGLHPFVVKKAYYLCNQFSLPQLKDIYKKIYITDSNIKTGKMAPEMALEMLVSEI